MPSHEDYKELLIPHALDALDGAEARSLEAHLQACGECRTEFEAWRETTATLAFAAETREPSAHVRTRILEGARSLAQTPSGASDKREAAETVTNHAGAKSANVVRMPARTVWSHGQIFGAIAASLIIVALSVGFIQARLEILGMKSDMQQLSAQLDEKQKEIARLREDRNLLTAPGASMATLGGTEMARDARAMVSYNRQTGHAMLVADGLPPAPAGKAYQLWFIVEGKPPMPGGVFTTDDKGHGELRDRMPPEGRHAGVFAVTLERAGGVPAPEGKAYLQGKAAS